MKIVCKVLAIMVLASCVCFAGGSLGGVILESGNQVAVVGARVLVIDKYEIIADGTTNESGEYLIENIAPGTYQVQILAKSYGWRYIAKCEIPDNTNSELNVLDMAAEGKIRGRVVNENGIGMRWVTLSLSYGRQYRNLPSVISDWDGYFEFDMLPSGRYEISLGFDVGVGEGKQKNISVSSGEITAIPDLVAKKNDCAVFGQVLDCDGNFLFDNDLRVYLIDSFGDTEYLDSVDDTGRFEIDNIVSGDYILATNHSGKGGKSVKIEPSQKLKFDLTVPCGTIIGKVTNAKGEPIVGVTVVASGTGKGLGASFRAKTDSKGYYELKGLESADYTLFASDTNGHPSNFGYKNVQISDSSAIEIIDFVMGPSDVASVLEGGSADSNVQSLIDFSEADNNSDASIEDASSIMYDFNLTISTGNKLTEALQDVYGVGGSDLHFGHVIMTEDGFYMEIKNEQAGTVSQRVAGSFADNKFIILLDNMRSYIIVDSETGLALENYNQMLRNPRELFGELSDKQFVDIGESEIAGVKARGVKYDNINLPGLANTAVIIWTNPKNGLPLSCELLTSMGVSDSGIEIKYIMDNFKWNIKVDPSVFKPEIPDNYQKNDVFGMLL